MARCPIKSRIAFHEMLTSILSSQGYLKLTSIMQLDDILNSLYQEAFDKKEINETMLKRMQELKWSHDNFFISIWGKPNDKAAWGMNFGGHHIALSVTITGTSIAVSPFFIGTDPSQVKSAKYAGWRILSKEEDYGFMLLNFLSEKQKPSSSKKYRKTLSPIRKAANGLPLIMESLPKNSMKIKWLF